MKRSSSKLLLSEKTQESDIIVKKASAISPNKQAENCLEAEIAEKKPPSEVLQEQLAPSTEQ